MSETKPDVIVKLGNGATFRVSVTKVELQVPLKAIKPRVESVDIVPAGRLNESPVPAKVAPKYQ